MKTTLIFTAIFFFAALMGCSDNLGINDPLNMDNYASGQTKGPGTPYAEVIWELKELAVSTSASTTSQFENWASCFSDGKNASGYKLEFDVYTNADRFTNGYRPLVNINRDEETVFSSSEFPGPDGEEIAHVEIDLDFAGFNEMGMYIALLQVDVPHAEDDDSSVILKLSKITLYRMN